MAKEEVLIVTKKNCEKCVFAKDLGEKLKEKYSVKYLPIEGVEGLTEFTLSGYEYPPVIIYRDKRTNSVKIAENDLLGDDNAKT